MKCKKCGFELNDKMTFCKKCGTEVQVIPDYDETEHDMSNDRQDVYKLGAVELTPKQKRIKTIIYICGLSALILVMLLGIILFFVLKGRNNSYQYQMDRAEEYRMKNEFEKTVLAYEKAIDASRNDKETTEVYKALADYYRKSGDSNNAIYYYEAAVDKNNTDADSVKQLISLYEKKYDTESIVKLASKAKGKAVSSLFEKYMLNQPVFNYKSGTYNELINVEITSADKEAIYYTLDGTQASENSLKYTEPIPLPEGRTAIHAITINQNGYKSDEIVTNYEILFDAPPEPVILPETGNYSDTQKITVSNIPTNCHVYYTTDGTPPNAQSNIYSEPVDMVLGNYIFSAVTINDQTGAASNAVSKIYDLNINGKIKWSEASALVLRRLSQENMISNLNGAMDDGTVCRPQTITTCKIGTNNFYIVKCFKIVGEKTTDMNLYYAVNMNTGNVYAAISNGAGSYNLAP